MTAVATKSWPDPPAAQAIDTDGDGCVDAEELAAFFEGPPSPGP